MITIQEILGTDSIAPSRLTINSNFLLIENEINDLEDTFNINVVTGSMDISQASSGQLKAKTFYANQATFPAAGTPTVNIYGTGASAGNASFAGTVSSANLNVSATGSFNRLNATGPATFGATGTFNGNIVNNAEFVNGPTGTYIEKNSIGASGATNAFLSPANGGGGLTGTYSNPYALSLNESVIYANCGYTSVSGSDAASPLGFFFYVATGSAPANNPPAVPQGFRLTIVNTNQSAGLIGTGVTGPNGSTYYTGFSTGNGQFPGGGITVPNTLAYKASVTLQWENRIGKNNTSQNGSWVVISSSGYSASDLY